MSPDAELRQAERQQNWSRYWNLTRRLDLFYTYTEPLGPLSILEQHCAKCGTIGIMWSNCSYCRECHGVECIIEWTLAPGPIGMVYYEPGRIESGHARPCDCRI